jgi:hypothetical protein
VFPSWDRRGGCAIKKKFPFLSGADGLVRRDEMFPKLTTPSALFNGGFAAFFLGARPPLLSQEGNTLFPSFDR